MTFGGHTREVPDSSKVEMDWNYGFAYYANYPRSLQSHVEKWANIYDNKLYPQLMLQWPEIQDVPKKCPQP